MISPSLLNDTATIERGTPTTDANRQRVNVFAEIATGVPCRIRTRSAKQRVYSEGRLVNGDSVADMYFSADIREGDRITSGRSGKIYDVIQVADAAGQGDHWVLDMNTFQAGG